MPSHAKQGRALDSTTGNGPTPVNNYQGQVSNCDPKSSRWQLGTRTMWNPVPDIWRARVDALVAGASPRGATGSLLSPLHANANFRNPIRASSGCIGAKRTEPMVLRQRPRSCSSLMLMETICVAASIITSVAVNGASSLSRALVNRAINGSQNAAKAKR
jgi:hypothetical protein